MRRFCCSFLLSLLCLSFFIFLPRISPAADDSAGDSARSALPIRFLGLTFDPLDAGATQRLLAENAETDSAPGEPTIRLVQFAEPPTEALVNEFHVNREIELIAYIPENAYLVRVRAQKDRTVARNEAKSYYRELRWSGPVPARAKLHPHLARLHQHRRNSTETLTVDVQVVRTGFEERIGELIRNRGGRVLRQQQWDTTLRITAELPYAAIEALQHQNAVVWISRWEPPRLRGERGAQIGAGNLNEAGSCATGPGGGYQSWLDFLGLGGEGYVVQVMDDGLSQGIDTNAPGTAHPDILGRIAKIDNATPDPLGDGKAGHGHINASIIMGQPIVTGQTIADADGFLLGQGVAPRARVYATKIFRNSGTYDIGSWTLPQLAARASQAGVLVSSNSWGSSTSGGYDLDSQDFDRLTRDCDPDTPGYQPMTFVFAAGNDGPGQRTVGSPATGKNVIAVGAGENCDAGPTDGCGYGSAQSDSARDLADFSSRGPTSDGRIAPTIIAPGVHVTGAASDAVGYDGTGVCGSPSSGYHPSGQTRYTWSSGTSHSTPLVAGGVILFMEYYKKNFGVNPSPALVRAALVNAATDCVGGSSNDGKTIAYAPDMRQGWGRMNLRPLLQPESMPVYVDQTTIFTGSGQYFEKKVQISRSDRPLRITLAWTDYPSFSGAAKTLVNDLDLSLSLGGITWLGNVFENGESVPGGTPDRLNPTESIYVSTPTPGIYTIRVSAHLVAADALPLSGGSLEQDFALVVSNAAEQGPAGIIGWDRALYPCSGLARVFVSDTHLRGAGSVNVELRSLLTTDVESLTLTETPAGGGILWGTIQLGAGGGNPGNGRLETAHNDVLTADYLDADTGSGSPEMVSAEALVDCQPPQLLNQQVVNITDISAELLVQTDKDTTLTLEYGASCSQLTATRQSILFGKSHHIALDGFNSCTRVFYRILAGDRAGNVAIFDALGGCYSFMTLEKQEVFSDTLEPLPAAGWTHGANRGVDDWAVVSTSYARSATHAWFSADVGTHKDAFLISPPFDIEGLTRLEFWHTYAFEAGYGDEGYDGGVMEISTDGGGSWRDLGDYIHVGEYNSVLSTFFENPLGGREAWSGGTLGPMTRVEVDLSDFPGTGRKVRWRIACDVDTTGNGWYIDDVSVWSMRPCMGSAGMLRLDAETVGCAGRFGILLRDLDLAGAGTAEVVLETSHDGAQTSLILLETEPEGAFEAKVELLPDAGGGSWIGGILFVQNGDSIKVTYQDADQGNGSPAIVNQVIRVDCEVPVISNVRTATITAGGALIEFDTNEPARGWISLGRQCETQQMLSSDTVVSTSHAIPVSGLEPDTSYYFIAYASDTAGNRASNSNGGQCHSFATLGAALDLSGWVIRQENSTQSFSIPSGTTLDRGEILIVARQSSRTAFEEFWDVTLSSTTKFINAAGVMPQINGDETFRIETNLGVIVDGPTIAMPVAAGESLQRIDFSMPANQESAWRRVPSAVSSASPGVLDAPPANTGKIVISEVSDATGAGYYVYEYLEFYYDAVGQTPTPTLTPTPTPTVSSSPTPSPSATPSPTPDPSATPTATATPSYSPTGTASPSPTETPTETATPTPSITDSPSPTPSATATPSPTETPAETATPTPAITDSPSPTPSATASPTSSPSPTETPEISPTVSATASPSPTPISLPVLQGLMVH